MHLDIAWLAAVVNYSLVAIELEAVDPAQQLADLLAPYHDQVAYQGVIGQEPVAVCLGGLASVLHHYDAAETYFAEATELCARGSMKYAEAHAQLLWGRMLAVRGRATDSARARTILQHAHATATSNGYAMIEQKTAAALSTLS